MCTFPFLLLHKMTTHDICHKFWTLENWYVVEISYIEAEWRVQIIRYVRTLHSYFSITCFDLQRNLKKIDLFYTLIEPVSYYPGSPVHVTTFWQRRIKVTIANTNPFLLAFQIKSIFERVVSPCIFFTMCSFNRRFVFTRSHFLYA